MNLITAPLTRILLRRSKEFCTACLNNSWCRINEPEKLLKILKANALCVIFMILVSLENVQKCALGGCTMTSKTKINVFFTLLAPSGPFRSKKIQKALILAFEANIALSC